MRIAIISSLFPPFAMGGAEQLAGQLTCALDELGHEVEVISTARRSELDGRHYRTDYWHGVRVWRVAPWSVYWHFDKQRTEPNSWTRAAWHAIDLWNPSILDPVRRVLGRIRPDVINTHNIDGLSPAVWQVARHYTDAIAHTLHDCHLICPRATMRRADGSLCHGLCTLCRVYAGYHQLFQRNVKVLIAPSAAIAGLHRSSGWSGPGIEVIPNGIDTRAVELPEVTAGDPLRVLFLSRLEREKGCETLLAAIESLGDERGIEFHVAGAGEYEKRFSQLASRVPNLIWHGFATGEDKHAVLSRADAFLQISECFENSPLAMIEAKRYGLYLLGTNIGGIPEYIGSPDEGLRLPPGDTQKLVAELQVLCAARDRIRRGRRQRIAKNAGYGTREMAERYVQVFRSLSGSAG